MKIQVSRHAEKRMRERCGLNRKAVERMAQKAYDKGIKHSQTKANLNKWVTGLWSRNKNADNIRIYGDKVYIFCGNVLVTVIQIPRNLAKNLKDMVKN